MQRSLTELHYLRMVCFYKSLMKISPCFQGNFTMARVRSNAFDFLKIFCLSGRCRGWSRCFTRRQLSSHVRLDNFVTVRSIFFATRENVARDFRRRRPDLRRQVKADSILISTEIVTVQFSTEKTEQRENLRERSL